MYINVSYYNKIKNKTKKEVNIYNEIYTTLNMSQICVRSRTYVTLRRHNILTAYS